ncbi:MAG: hypothetical protein QOF62_2533 [Pyrinomonadaceae bacterium]|jgi:hypothetical protein|nr:hypothetical protein [Pyrinomonadaceae bacterium]
MKSPIYNVVLALVLTISMSVTQNRALGQSISVAPEKREEPSPLKDYVGRYELASSEISITTIDVTLTKQGLWAKPSLAAKRKLMAQSKTEFLDELENARYTFTRGESKKVVSLTFEYQGKTYTARKLEPVAPSLTGNVTFQLLRYPDANIVALAGSFNNWNQSQTLCAKEGDRWVCRMKLEPGKYLYKFIVDGDWITDPDNRNTEDDGNGNINSVLVVMKHE